MGTLGFLTLLLLPWEGLGVNTDKDRSRNLPLSERPEQICSLQFEYPDKMTAIFKARSGVHGHPDPIRVLETRHNRSYGDPGTTDVFCGATVVHNSYLITAAHCVDEMKNYPASVHCPGGITRKLLPRKITLYPNWDKNQRSRDLALIEVSPGLGIEPLQPPEDLKHLQELTQLGQCATLGYGKSGYFHNRSALSAAKKYTSEIRTSSEDFFNILLYAGILVLEKVPNPGTQREILKELTDELYQDTTIRNDPKILVIGDRTHMRGGDSGGGLYCKDKNGTWFIIGIITSHIPSRLPILEVYQSSLYYRDFITQHKKADANLQSKVNALKRQIDHYCKRSNTCLSTLPDTSRDLFPSLYEVLGEIEKLRANEEDLLLELKLQRLKESYVLLTEKCYHSKIWLNQRRDMTEAFGTAR